MANTDYKPTPRKVGDTVYSTGFHDSKTNVWVPPCTQGTIMSVGAVCLVQFDSHPLAEFPIMKNDVRTTVRSAAAVNNLDRRNLRWIE